jgi:hypothetical protein
MQHLSGTVDVLPGSMDRWIDGSMDRWIDGSMDRWIRSTVDAPAQLHTHSMAPQQNTTMIKTEGAKNSAALIWEICCVVAWIDGSKVDGPAQLHTKQGTTAVPYYPQNSQISIQFPYHTTGQHQHNCQYERHVPKKHHYVFLSS